MRPAAASRRFRVSAVIGADTCHIDVIDRFGNMVSATPSGGWLQSSPVIPELGFPMGTRGQMFWLRPGLPNSLAPKKRPRTTLSPSFALRDGKPWMAFGTPGGEQQDQWSLIFFLRMVHQLADPAGDRCAGVSHRTLAFEFLAAGRPARQGGAGRPFR